MGNRELEVELGLECACHNSFEAYA